MGRHPLPGTREWRGKSRVSLRASGMTFAEQEKHMPRFLERGMDAGAIEEADAKVRATVESILGEIKARGDDAVRALSEQFDKWSPASFKLTAQEVEKAIGQVARRDLEDIKFAQAQVRGF